ncbi:hypothetical protein [Geodermatophilus ruber]|uniref:hypothetical protein n=1 Tax=Geodermatophilus ruber TaxID=504800 RepID=UPI0015A57739|nr:hypothetical protein [Geodermatophilus ruber]
MLLRAVPGDLTAADVDGLGTATPGLLGRRPRLAADRRCRPGGRGAPAAFQAALSG